ncbi:MAG TPA: FISUMP domain-containing protein [Bacteroidales bacterium]|nr:FISUMP domain-containing protein [Bacteroidales bacterium]
MKKFISLIVVALAMVNFANAQNFYLNFEGTPQFIPVDSLIVTNLNTQETANLAGSDELHLVAPQLARTLSNNQNNKLFMYPNPAPGYCSFDIPVDRDAWVTIDIFDLTGKKLLSDTRFLDKAIYNIMLKGLSSGVYTVVAKSDNFLFTGKVIGSENNNYQLALEYTGKSELSPEYLQLRELQDITDMVYSFGDILLFRAFSGQDYITLKTLIINPEDAIAQQENITLSFAFFVCTDPDNYTYPVVTIGDQVWMAENLKTASYRNQNEIPEVTDSLQWLSLLTGACCSYSNNPENDSLFGKLYNWYAVDDTAGICPQGWHVPSDSEWMELETYLGMDDNFIDTLGWRGQNEGCYLKDSRSNIWFSLTGDDLNASGFSAVPAGMRNFVSAFYYRGEYATWWAASESNGQDAWSRAVSYDKCSIYREDGRKTLGLSVRCIKDEEVEPQPVAPTVVTAEVSGINKTSAISGGEVTNDGGDPVTARGIVWSSSPNPSVDINSGITSEGDGTGVFSSDMTGLSAETLYYVRAYASNSIGTAYGQELSFTTLAFAIPAVTTNPATQVGYTSAVSGGNVSDEGDGLVSVKGIVWSTTNTPSLSSNEGLTVDGEGPGMFISNIDELLPGTTYYVRAYATSEYGTAYGEEIAFSTLAYSLPVLATEPVTEITTTSAISGGNITENGGDVITARGVVWNTLGEPDIENNEGITNDGDGMGVFISNMEDLSPGQTYYVRAYATNSAGTAYGEELSFVTLPLLYTTGDGVYDIDDNFYPTVIINGREWMSQNLRVSQYNGMVLSGDILKITDNSEWGNYIDPEGAYCWYNNDSTAYEETYGKLYNWYAVATDALCPAGWQVPTDTEWKELEMFLGMLTEQADAIGWRGTNEGGKLKLYEMGLWNDPNAGANGQSGFDAVPGGYRSSTGSFAGMGNDNFLWGSDPSSSSTAWSRNLNFNYSSVKRNDEKKLSGFSVRCVKTEGTVATVTTSDVSAITTITAFSGGEITDDGGQPVTNKGIVWGTSPDPTLSSNTGSLSNGSGTENYTSYITGLDAGATYYVKAYATNALGTAYGEEVSFSTLSYLATDGAGVYDADGNFYNTIVINEREWMAENLRTSTYNAEGDKNNMPIQHISNNGEWANTYDGAYCWYNNDSATYDLTYGKLYNWHAVNNYVGLCPEGWAIPTDVEWKELEMFLGMSQGDADNTGWRGTDEGGKLKEVGTAHWNEPNSAATNQSKFALLPGGFRNNEGGYSDIGNSQQNDTYSDLGLSGYFWTSEESTSYENAWARMVQFDLPTINRSEINKHYGMSVRCIKQITPPFVETALVTDITSSTAVCGGNVTSDGGKPVTARGVMWEVFNMPKDGENMTNDGEGVGEYVSNITGLQPNTTYIVYAYATNEIGTGYGEWQFFTTQMTVQQRLDYGETPKQIYDDGIPIDSLYGKFYAGGYIFYFDPVVGIGMVAYESDFTEVNWGCMGYETGANETLFGTGRANTELIFNVCPDQTAAANLIYSQEYYGYFDWALPSRDELVEMYTKKEYIPGFGDFSYWSSSEDVTDPMNSAWCMIIGETSLSSKSITYNARPIRTFGLEDVYDYEGNSYGVVVIGTQVWMAENLRSTYFQNGEWITLTTDDTEWYSLIAGSPSYCYYDNMIDYLYSLGGLYNFYAAADSRNICPYGYHVPTDAEWTTLVTYLGGEGLAGGALKVTGADYWGEPNIGATNSTNFNALGAGMRNGTTGLYDGMLMNTGYWTSTPTDVSSSWLRTLSFNNAAATRTSNDNHTGASVRCIRD